MKDSDECSAKNKRQNIWESCPKSEPGHLSDKERQLIKTLRGKDERRELQLLLKEKGLKGEEHQKPKRGQKSTRQIVGFLVG